MDGDNNTTADDVMYTSAIESVDLPTPGRKKAQFSVDLPTPGQKKAKPKPAEEN